jgi:hypothetical protein
VTSTRLKSLAALIIFVLAVLGTPIAVIGHWGHRTVVDQPTYLEIVSPLATNPEVQQAVADVVTDSITAQVDTKSAVDSFLQRLLPDSPISDVLSNPITAGINNLVEQLVLQFLQSELFAEVWIDVNTGIQDSLVRVLEGDTGGVVFIENDQLVLDVSTLVIKIQERLVDRGYGIAANIEVEPGTRTIVLADTPGISQIQFIYSLLNPLFVWALAFLAMAYGATVLLARNRPRQTMFVGVAILAWGIALRFALNQGQTGFENALAATPLAAASNAFWTTLFANLTAGVATLMVLGVILLLVGFFAGRTRFALGVRQQVNGLVQEARDALPAHWHVPWIGSHMTLSTTIVIVVFAGWFSLSDGFSTLRLLIATVLALAGVFMLHVLGGERERELVG